MWAVVPPDSWTTFGGAAGLRCQPEPTRTSDERRSNDTAAAPRQQDNDKTPLGPVATSRTADEDAKATILKYDVRRTSDATGQHWLAAAEKTATAEHTAVHLSQTRLVVRLKPSTTRKGAQIQASVRLKPSAARMPEPQDCQHGVSRAAAPHLVVRLEPSTMGGVRVRVTVRPTSDAALTDKILLYDVRRTDGLHGVCRAARLMSTTDNENRSHGVCRAAALTNDTTYLHDVRRAMPNFPTPHDVHRADDEDHAHGVCRAAALTDDTTYL